MRFNVPQFIEEESKIIGPLTFKQFIFIGTAAALCFVLYYTAPFSVFLAISIFLLGGGSAFAFLKIGGLSLLTILTNLLKFSSAPKMYIWKKREKPGIKIYKKRVEIEKKEKNEEELPLKSVEKSRLKKLQTEIETKTK